MITKEVAHQVDSYLTTAVHELRKTAKAGKLRFVDFAAVADEIERIRDDWRLRRRADGQH